MKIVVFTKKNKATVRKVIGLLKARVKNCVVYQGELTDKFPEGAYNDSQDVVISYLSPWIIPKAVLRNTKLYNINFHTGPSEYPGIGCVNFAIYNGEKEYGVICHHMNEKVDTGEIIKSVRFPVLESDTVFSLTERCYVNLLILFEDVLESLLNTGCLPKASERWKRKPYTRRELEDLCKISSDMSKDEVKRRIRATEYPGMPGAYIDLFGQRFEYNPDSEGRING